MLPTAVTLRVADGSDIDIILAWWALPEIRRHTGAVAIPDYEEVCRSLARPGRRDYMIMFEGRRIGRTCLIPHEAFEELSVYVCELGLQGKGAGKIAIALTAELARQTEIRAWILKSNFASQKAFLANGFHYLSEEGEACWYAKYRS